ncbi:zinc finger, CCHC-type containing protein [Tanacetum coccineum]
MASMNTRLNIKKLDGNIGAQGDHEAEVFQVSDDDTALAQRRLEDKQPKEKTNTDCLVKEQEKEYQTGWKIKTGNVLDSCNQRSTQQCMKSGVAKHLGVAGIQQQNGLVNETNVTLFAKVRCFLIQSGLSKVFWAEDTTMSTYLVNRSPSSAIGFKTPIDMLGFFGWLASIKQGMLEPVKVKCIFLGYRKVQVLQGVEFEVEPQEDHTFEVEPHGNVDHVAGSQEVQTQDLIYYHSALACEVISKWKAGLKIDMIARQMCMCSATVARNAVTTAMAITGSIHQAKILATKGLLDKAKGNVLGVGDIVRIVIGNNSKGVHIQVLQRKVGLDIASANVGMLDKFDRGLQTDVHVLWILTTSWVDQSQGGYLAKGPATGGHDSRLKDISGIATGALLKAVPRSRFQHRLLVDIPTSGIRALVRRSRVEARYLRQREVSRGSFSVRFSERSGRYTDWATRSTAGLFGFVGFLDKEHNQRVRMKALLEQQRLVAALEELPATTIAAYDHVIRKKDFSALILCLGDWVLREITKETTATGFGKR